MRDLFLYGDQFVNFLKTDTASNLVGAPTVGLLRRFLAAGDLDEFFKAPANNLVRQDGVTSLTIMGAQTDYTATIDR